MSNEQTNLNEDTNTDAAEPVSPQDQPPDQASAEMLELPVLPAPEADASAAASDLVEINPVSLQPAIELHEAKRGLEAALLAASEPMPLQELKKIFDGELSADILRNLLDEIKTEWADRSVELAIVASGYRFRVKPDYQKYIDRLTNEKPLKYSRAVLETMAIIAYRQPVTRSDIEDIRGVAVSPHILKTLEDRGWIDEIGHKDAPGRPALFATTKHFLDDLNLLSLDALPPLHELQATLDMSQAGAALHVGAETFALPGVATSEVAASDEMDANETSNEINLNSGDNAAEINSDPNQNANHNTGHNTNHGTNHDANHDANHDNNHDAPHAENENKEANENASNDNSNKDSAGNEHENHPQEPGASS